MDDAYLCASAHKLPKRKKRRLIVITDWKNVVGIVKLPKKSPSISKLRKEFESILYPGKNPCKYDSPEQFEWLKKIHHREKTLAAQYETKYFGPETFINWLIKEKGAIKVKYSEHCFPGYREPGDFY